MALLSHRMIGKKKKVVSCRFSIPSVIGLLGYLLKMGESFFFEVDDNVLN